MDESGLHDSGALWALGFEQGRAHSLPLVPVQGPAPGESEWTWIHFPLRDVRARKCISRLEGLPEAALDLIESGDDRIQLAGEGEWAFGVLPDFERELSGDPTGAGRLFFVLDRSRLVTARLHPLKVIDDVRRAAERGAIIEGPAQAIISLVERYTELLEIRLEALSDRLDAVEDQVLGGPSDLEDLKLGAFRREVARHGRELQSLRRALVRARSGRSAIVASPLVDELNLLVSPIEDLDRDASALQERARLLHEEIDTLLTGATNRSMRMLTVISTLLIPPTLVVGAFGMNLEGIPFARSPGGFASVTIICVLIVAGALAYLKRLRLLP